MKPFFVFGILCLSSLASCSIRYVNYSVNLPPRIDLSQSAVTILLINRFDANQLEFKRDKKISVVREGSISMLKLLENDLAHIRNVKVISAFDSVTMARDIHAVLDSGVLVTDQVNKLAEKYGADYILSLENYQTGFRQDEVVKEKNSDGSSSKTAFYSIYAKSIWAWYQVKSNTFEELTGNASIFHSKRSVVSGLLAFGPALAPNGDDIRKVSELGALNLAANYRGQSRPVFREVYSDKLLKSPGAAMMNGDYGKARELLSPLAKSGDAETASKALYNLAVLAELEGNGDSAKEFALLSLNKKDNRLANVLMGKKRSLAALINQSQ